MVLNPELIPSTHPPAFSRTGAGRQRFIVATMQTPIAQLNHQPQRARSRHLLPGFLTAFILFCMGCKPEPDAAGDAQSAAIKAAAHLKSVRRGFR
jgi:hypothetical protein